MKNYYSSTISSIFLASEKVSIRLKLPILFILFWGTNFVGFGQNLTQSGFTGVIVPQYMASGTASRLPVIFRATVSGLTANTSYRYYAQGATNSTVGGGTVDFGTANSGAGNPLLINATGTTFSYPSPSLSTAGGYETLTTDATGSYTGWFGFVNTGNARFTAGNTVFPTITLNTGGTGTTVNRRLALDIGITILAFGGAGTNNGSLLQSISTSATAKNLVAIYDNTAGSGRPLSVSVIESIGVTIASLPTAYSVSAGSWNTITPNTNSNGVRRIEQRGVTNNTIIGCAIDADGVWTTGSINTVNPTTGTTATIINPTDAPLNSCVIPPVITSSLTATGVVGTPISGYTITGSNSPTTFSASNLPGGLTFTSPTISGTPTNAGTFNATISASSIAGSDTKTLVFTIDKGNQMITGLPSNDTKTYGDANYSLTASSNSGLTVSYSSTNTSIATVSGNTVTIVGNGTTTITASQSGDANYNAATSINQTLTVTPKTLTITSPSVPNKVYDRTNVATITGTLSGIVPTDIVTLNGTGTFSQVNVGSGLAVTSTSILSGTDALKYSLTQPTGLTGEIVVKPLTVSGASVSDKVYDSNSSLTLVGATLNGILSPDVVTLTGGALFSSVNVGNNIAINTSSLTLGGADAGNYFALPIVGLTGNITTKPLTISGLTANNKVFDGTTTSTLSGTATLNGVISGEEANVTLTGTPTANFAQSTAGNGIAVTVSGYSLSGSASVNYSLSQPSGLTADITTAPSPSITSTLTASATYSVASTSYFITAINSPTSFNATGLPTGLSINTSTGEISGTPTDVAGSPFSVTISATNLGGTGTATLVYTVNPKVLTITSPTVPNKVYDRTNAATITGNLLGIVPTDIVTLNGTGTFSQVNVGSGLTVTSTSILSGTDATKYTLIQPIGLTANITSLALTVTSAIAQNKVFDGNTNATITGTLTGVISPDVVTFIGTGTFVSSTVGNGIAVTSTSTLAGAGASNYTLTQPTGLLANITAPQFGTGNLVVVNVNSTNSVSLIEYSNSGTLQQTFSIPSTGTDALTISYTATSEGALSRSSSGYYLGLAGYRTGTSGSVPVTDRVVARINSNGTVNAKSTIPNSEGYGNNNIRAAVFNDDGSRFWTSGTGSSAGVRTNVFEATSGSTQVSTTLTNTRAINIFNNQLYISSASGTFQGLSSVGIGLPTTTGNTITLLPGFPAATGSYGFAINSTSTIAYVADDRASALGGIQKWTFNGSTWTLAYTLGTGVVNNGTRGLAVDWSGANPIIYATTAEATLNRIIKITDSGSSSTASTLATSATNNIFRGLAFSPILAPTSVSLSVNSNAGTEAAATVITVTATASSPVVGNQTVSLGITGTNIAAGDYTLSSSTITIPNGGTTGSVTFTIVDDIISEATETAILTISNPSSGIILGSPTTQNITITDNDNTAPTIAMNVTTTSNYVDGGIATSPLSSFATSGVLNDSTDPTKNFGIDFTIGDAETAVGSLIVTATSSNLAVLPLANLNLTGMGASRNLKITPNAEGFSDVTITVNDGTTTSSFTINYASSNASINTATTRFHTGTSDASTAQMIDNNFMIVGDDENQALRLYDRQNSGLSIKSFDFTTSLGLTDLSSGSPREVDIEASAKVGNRIYWMGSHSNASSGNNRPNRSRFFATDISGTGNSTTLSYIGRYDNLKSDLLAWDAANGHGLGANFLGLAASSTAGIAPEIADGSGFNIEGFEIAPNNTTAYICFRAPLQTNITRTKALIIPLTNFANLVSGNPTSTTATFGTPIQLDLGGRAIREMKKNASGEYLIIAGSNDGSTAVAPKDFRFYTWTGNPTDAPILRSANLTALNSGGSFESIVDLPSPLLSSSNLQVLIDNGDAIFYGNGTIAKELPQNNHKKFRSENINLGTEALAIGVLSSTNFCSNTPINIPFTTSETFNAGNIFTAQLSNATGSFTSPVSIGTLTGTNSGTIVATIPLSTTPGGNYRIRVVSSNNSIIGADNGVNLIINNCTTLATIKSIKTGDWNVASTWNLGRVPQAGDLVIIDQNHEVTLDGTGTAKRIEYQGTGKLKFSSASSTLNTGL
jgi:YDG domain